VWGRNEELELASVHRGTSINFAMFESLLNTANDIILNSELFVQMEVQITSIFAKKNNALLLKL